MKTLIVVFLLCCLPSFALNYTATQSGNWSDPATWGGLGVPGAGDTALCATGSVILVDANVIVGSSPVQGGTAALRVAGGCVVRMAANTTLVLYGDLALDHGTFLVSAGSMTTFDSSNAASPSMTHYAIRQGAAANHVDTIVAIDGANPTTQSNPAVINANVITGANWLWVGAANSMNINLSFTTLQFLGTPGTPGLVYLAGGSLTPSFQNVIFDHSCGVKYSGSVTPNDGWSFKSSSFKNTYAGCIPWYAVTRAPASGVSRIFDGVVFDAPPTMEGQPGIVYTNSIFLKGYTDASLLAGQGPITRSLIVISWQTGSGLTWAGNLGAGMKTLNFDHDLFVGDPTTTFVNGVATAQVPLTSGTVSGAVVSHPLSGTLPDATQHWTAHAYRSSVNDYMVVITGGTGAGQARNIFDNTSTVLTTLGAWDVIPDASSTYAIYAGVLNPHWTNGGSLPNGATASETYNIGVLASGGDNNGDFWHSVNAVTGPSCTAYRGAWSPSVNYANHDSVILSGGFYSSMTAGNVSNNPAIDDGSHWQPATEDSLGSGCATYIIDYTLLLPNATHDNSGTLITGGLANYKMHHNTYFTGAQSAAFDEARPGTPPFSIREFNSNLAWAESGKSYVSVGSGTPRASSTGPYLITDSGSGGPRTGYVPDFTPNVCFGGSAACIDFNGDFALLSNAFCASVAGSNQGGSPAYNVRCSTALGLHDITADPQFVNRWATPQTWIQSLGIDVGSNDPVQVLPDVWNCIMKVNDFAGANPSCTVQNLYGYLWNAYAPQNPAYQATAPDGTDIGAVPVVLPH